MLFYKIRKWQSFAWSVTVISCNFLIISSINESPQRFIKRKGYKQYLTYRLYPFPKKISNQAGTLFSSQVFYVIMRRTVASNTVTFSYKSKLATRILQI
jgi:hypothetical protein